MITVAKKIYEVVTHTIYILKLIKNKNIYLKERERERETENC